MQIRSVLRRVSAAVATAALGVGLLGTGCSKGADTGAADPTRGSAGGASRASALEGYWLSNDDQRGAGGFLIQAGQVGENGQKEMTIRFVVVYSDGEVGLSPPAKMSPLDAEGRFTLLPLDGSHAPDADQPPMTYRLDDRGSVAHLVIDYFVEAYGPDSPHPRLRPVSLRFEPASEALIRLQLPRLAFRREQDYKFAHRWCDKRATLTISQKQVVDHVLERAEQNLQTEDPPSSLELVRTERRALGQDRSVCEIAEDLVERGPRAAKGDGSAFNFYSMSSFELGGDLKSAAPLSALELDSIRLTGAEIEDLESLVGIEGLTSIEVRDADVELSRELLQVLPLFSTMTSLRISRASATAAETLVTPAALASQRNLHELSITGYPVSAEHVQAIAGMTKLRRLSLAPSSGQSQPLDLSALSSLKGLTQLYLPDQNQVAWVKGLDRLEAITIGAPIASDLQALAQLPGLQDLELSKPVANGDSLSPLARSASLYSLRLRMSEKNPSLALLTPLAPRIESLDVRFESETGTADAASLGELANLHAVRLRGAKLADPASLVDRLLSRPGIDYLSFEQGRFAPEAQAELENREARYGKRFELVSPEYSAL